MKITNIYPLKIEIQDVINGEYVKPNMIPFVNESFRLIVLNLIMFFPFGIFIPKIFSRIEWNFRRIFICMFFITIVIEILQIFGGRMFDIDDIIMNTTGGILGFCVFSNRFFKKKENS
jgi:glycopeptide antibiotics resistance protein